MSTTVSPSQSVSAQPVSSLSGVRPSRALIYAALIIVAGLFLIPVYMVLVTSFKSIDQVSISTNASCSVR